MCVFHMFYKKNIWFVGSYLVGMARGYSGVCLKAILLSLPHDQGKTSMQVKQDSCNTLSPGLPNHQFSMDIEQATKIVPKVRWDSRANNYFSQTEHLKTTEDTLAALTEGKCRKLLVTRDRSRCCSLATSRPHELKRIRRSQIAINNTHYSSVTNAGWACQH